MNFLKRRWREFILGLVNTLFCGTRMFAVKRALLNSCANLHVGEGTKVVGPVKMGNCAKLQVGAACWIGAGMTVLGDGTVTIGNCCDLAPEVAFITGSHEIATSERRAGKGKTYTITVGDGCWIGARSSITNSIAIDDGVVVGACSFVNKNVPSNTAVAGVPAKKIKELAQ